MRMKQQNRFYLFQRLLYQRLSIGGYFVWRLFLLGLHCKQTTLCSSRGYKRLQFNLKQGYFVFRLKIIFYYKMYEKIIHYFINITVPFSFFPLQKKRNDSNIKNLYKLFFIILHKSHIIFQVQKFNHTTLLKLSSFQSRYINYNIQHIIIHIYILQNVI